MQIQLPPALIKSILTFFLSPEHDSVIGDMDEEFEDNCAEMPSYKAIFIYFFQSLKIIPVIIFHSILWSREMFKNYLKIALRTMNRYKGFTAINLIGLAVAMSICLLIILFVKDQLSYENMHSRRDHIYRVTSKIELRPGGQRHFATTPASLADILKENYPAIETAVKIKEWNGNIIYDDHSFRVRHIFTEPAYFDMFNFRMQNGDVRAAISEPNRTILSPETARKIFQDEDPLGKIVQFEGVGEFVVAGILASPAGKSHLLFDAVTSYATVSTAAAFEESVDNWRQNFYSSYTYFQLKDDAKLAELEAQLPAILKQRYQPEKDDRMAISTFETQALTDVNLGESYTNMLGNPTPAIVVYVIGAIGLLIMLTACFNYMSLSVARSLKRAKEVGMRKVLGAYRLQIIRQFLSEACLASLLALVIAFGLLYWLLPAFNELRGVVELNSRIKLDIFQQWDIYLYFFGFSLLTALIAGLYPAVYLSAFVPLSVLKGIDRIRGFSGITVRKTLTVFQFSLSLLFIITCIVIYRQSAHILEADYGFNKENLITLDLQKTDYEIFRNEFANHASVLQISGTNEMPLTGSLNTSRLQIPGREGPQEIIDYAVDPNFIENMGLELIAGRNFSDHITTDQYTKIILNESAVTDWQLGNVDEAIGKTIYSVWDSLDFTVIGVVRNYHFDLTQRSIAPMILRYSPDRIDIANIRIQPGSATAVLDDLEITWKKLDPIHPIQYAEFGAGSISEIRAVFRDLIKITGFIGTLAVLIASLGLLAMTSYSTENRLKEVSIRKILGASISSVVVLLSKDFLKLLIISIFIAAPLAWFINSMWLQEMASQIPLGIDVFIMGILPILLIALAAVISQTLKAALANPVDTLRYE